MLLDAPTLAAIAVLAVGAAIVSGMSGFGAGVILTAALVPLIGPKAVLPVLSVAGIVINAGRFWFYREHLDRRMLVLVLAASLPFLVLGTWIYSILDARSLTLVLGVAVIASMPVRRVFHAKKMSLGPVGVATGSGVFGFAAGVASGAGVILVSLLLGAGLATPAVLATDAMVSIVLDLCKAALFNRFDLLNADAFFTGAVIGLASIPGSAIAAWLVSRMGAKLHILFMEILILFGGVSMLWHALR
ncbi:MAG TPA: sulfite exporter TauE/SafE family protein [Burkholderiales bacterium]|nr:sulfite exporter TauE/SafE family protein [Burkholderiales bacterium]